MKKIIIAIIPVLVLSLGLVGYLEYDKSTGEEVVLKVVTFDPTDVFRGDYVNLAYDIQRIDTSKITEEYKDLNEGDNVCVKLDNSSPAEPISVFDKSNASTQTGTFICGKKSWSSTDFTNKYNDLTDKEKTALQQVAYGADTKYNYEKGEQYMILNGYKAMSYRIDYPSINKFFIPKGKGYAVDQYARDGRLSATVILTKEGTGYLKYLMLDGKEVDFSTIEAREY